VKRIKGRIASRKEPDCPVCNSLGYQYPNLAAQWHSEKNGTLTTYDVLPGSKKKIWWAGECTHEWQAQICDRVYKKSGCPVCANRVVHPDNCLATIAPELAKEWHPKKNGKLTPKDVLPGSSKKVWWQCSDQPDHEWEATLTARYHSKTGCHFCTGYRLDAERSLAAKFPDLVEEWHPEKNDLTPRDIAAFSNQTVWWKGKCGHEWSTTVANRTSQRSGCPVCANLVVHHDNCLDFMAPTLAAEWHPTKNGELKPSDFTYVSKHEAWWKGSCGHEWQRTIHARAVKNSTCPFCSNRLLHENNSLAVTDSDLAKEWHPTKNTLTPFDVMRNSRKVVWWKGECGHEWDTQIRYRTQYGNGCPFCSGQRVHPDLSIGAVNPTLARQWNKNRNGSLTPFDVLPQSTRSVWWSCKKGHEWKAVVGNRSRGNGCPKCSGREVSHDHNLAVVHPTLSKEWDLEKNGKIMPEMVTPGTPNKYWWKCEWGHSFAASVNARSRGSGCPTCKKRFSSSFAEQAVYRMILKFFEEAENRAIIQTEEGLLEVDIRISSQHTIVEFDGQYWHRNKKKTDQKKNYNLNQLKYRLIRIRVLPLPPLKGCDNIFIPDNSHDSLRVAGSSVLALLGVNIHPKDLLSEEEIQSIREDLFKIPHQRSLASLFPKLIAEWHEEKNGTLTPDLISYGSNIQVWWKADCGHEWQMPVKSRTGQDQGCPYCSRVRLRPENSLAARFSELVVSWHPTKNGELKPDQVSYASSRKLWWICEKGHEWQAKVSSRTQKKSGCPICAGRKVNSEHNLEVDHPKLVKEWNYTRNENLQPSQFVSGSHKKVWWKCLKGHEWQATIKNRTKGGGCSKCIGKAASKENNFAVAYPDRVAWWHSEKNGNLTPFDVTPHSDKKVWWRCNNGHEWEASVRYSKTCPNCRTKTVFENDKTSIKNKL